MRDRSGFPAIPTASILSVRAVAVRVAAVVFLGLLVGVILCTVETADRLFVLRGSLDGAGEALRIAALMGATLLGGGALGLCVGLFGVAGESLRQRLAAMIRRAAPTRSTVLVEAASLLGAALVVRPTSTTRRSPTPTPTSAGSSTTRVTAAGWCGRPSRVSALIVDGQMMGLSSYRLAHGRLVVCTDGRRSRPISAGGGGLGEPDSVPRVRFVRWPDGVLSYGSGGSSSARTDSDADLSPAGAIHRVAHHPGEDLRLRAQIAEQFDGLEERPRAMVRSRGDPSHQQRRDT